MLSQERNVEKCRSPDFPAFLVNLGLLVLVIVSLLFLNIHGFACIVHHTFNIEVEKLLYEVTEAIILLIQILLNLPAKGLDSVGQGSDSPI